MSNNVKLLHKCEKDVVDHKNYLHTCTSLGMNSMGGGGA